MEKSYKTIENPSTFELIEKKSKFIAKAYPINSEDEAQKIINEIRKDFYDARHHCYAYTILKETPIIKFNDDGEPSGTGGKPIFEALNNEKIQNTLIVVTRYFGGTLLGKAGLIRAYGGAAKEALKNAEVVQITYYKKIYIEVDYTFCGKIQYKLENEDNIKFEIVYTEIVKFIIYIEKNKEDKFIEEIINLTNKTCKIEIGENVKVKIINNKINLC